MCHKEKEKSKYKPIILTERGKMTAKDNSKELAKEIITLMHLNEREDEAGKNLLKEINCIVDEGSLAEKEILFNTLFCVIKLNCECDSEEEFKNKVKNMAKAQEDLENYYKDVLRFEEDFMALYNRDRLPRERID